MDNLGVRNCCFDLSRVADMEGFAVICVFNEIHEECLVKVVRNNVLLISCKHI
jgi:hypothetical protein